MRIQLKRLRDTSDSFEVSDLYSASQYRLCKETAKYVIDFLQEKADMNVQNSIPFHLRVLCTIHLYAHGLFQTPTGSNFNLSMSQSSVSRCLHQVTDLIEKHLPILVKFPTTEDEIAEAKKGFYMKFGLPGIISAVDGMCISPYNHLQTTTKQTLGIFIETEKDTTA